MDIIEEIKYCLQIKDKFDRVMKEILRGRKSIGMPTDDEAIKNIEKNVKKELGYDSHVEAVLKNYKTKL